MTNSYLIERNGKYHAMIYDSELPKGKQYIQRTTGYAVKNNKTKAEQRRKELEAEYIAQKEAAANKKEPPETVSRDKLFADCVNEWLEVASVNIRSNSYDIYKITANAHVIPYFQSLKIKVEELTPAHLQKYFKSKLKSADNPKGVARSTIAKHKTVINETLNHCVLQEYIKDNPMSKVSCSTKSEPVTKYYDTEQLLELFSRARDESIYSAILLSGTYGLRRSETLGLTWSAINFKKNTIEVSRSVVRVGSSVEERDIMKSKKSRRTLPLTDEVRDYLLKLKAEQAADKLMLGAGYVDSDFICRWRDGNQLSPDFVTHKFTKLIKAYGMPYLTFHCLRHSSASLLINNGYSLKEIAEWLGHEDIASTNRYSHLEYASKQRMADSVNELLSMKPKPTLEAEQAGLGA